MIAPHPRPWRRVAGVAALAVMLGPFAMSTTGCFTMMSMMAASATSSSPHIVPAGDAAHLDIDRELELHMKDGTTVSGRYRGRTLLDAETYSARFATRIAAGGWSPLALGESLTVELVDGTRRRGAFAGYGTRSIVLLSPADTAGERVSLRSATSIRRVGDGLLSIDSLLAADVRGELPSAEALVIREYDTARGISGFVSSRRVIPLEEVQWVTAYGDKKKASGLILFGVALDVVLFFVIKKAAEDAGPSCALLLLPLAASNDVRLTEKPFDRCLGLFVGENVAWGEPFPALPQGFEASSTADSLAASSGGAASVTAWR